MAFGILSPESTRGEHSYAQVLGQERTHSFDFHDVMVHAKHRGKGMQQKLIALFVEIARAMGGATIYATVDPDNQISWHNFEKAGYVCLCTQEAYDGRVRRYYRLEVAS